jgi:hypothetical protein
MQLHDRERLRLYAAHQELIVGPLRRAQAAELRSLNALRDEPDPRSEAKAQEYDELAFLAEESVRQIRTDLAIRRPVVKGWTVPRPRARGAGRPAVRGASKRSSARSGDSGEDGETEPPSRRRLCACCGRDIPADRGPRAKYIDDAHAARDRQRRKRQGDRA